MRYLEHLTGRTQQSTSLQTSAPLLKTSGFIGCSTAISGNSIMLTSGNAALQGQPTGDDGEKEDRIIVFALSIIAGADTVLTDVTINGAQGKVDVQCNTGGYIAAVISAWRIDSSINGGNINTYKAIINTTGTAPTVCGTRFMEQGGLYNRRVISTSSSTTAVDTTRTVTLEVVPRSMIVAAAITDVGAANSCIWTGTASASERLDAAVGTARASNSTSVTPNVGTAQTVIATFAVVSTVGISLAAAVYR